MPTIKNQQYHQRMNLVVRHIYAEIALPTPKGLTLDYLSGLACFSKYHFHRLFAAHVGMNLNQFIQRLRLKKASYQLAFQHEIKIIDIALEAAFENHESFSRAFKRIYKQTPSQFRKQPNWLEWSIKNQYQLPKEVSKVNVNIIQFPDTKVAALEHKGSPQLLNRTVAKFIEWRKSSGQSPVNSSQTYGIAYHDPATTPEDEFRWDACGSIKSDVRPNPQGVVTKTIPGGRCAHITHHGPHELMDDKIRYIYQQWVPENNEELRDFPCFFQYQNLFPAVAEKDLITDIFIPIV